MAAITKIEFWKDVGFLEGAIEIPSLSAADPINPDLTIEPQYPVMPSKERFFSKLKLKEYYEELMEMSYIRLTYELNTSVNGVTTTKIFYGWVREVSLESDGDLPVTVIDWHIDEWRTWKSSVSFGSGHVKRRPFVDLATTPIQDYQYRYLQLEPNFESNRIYLTDRLFAGIPGTFEVFWVIFSFNQKSTVPEGQGTRTVTETVYGTYPVLRVETGTYSEVPFKVTSDTSIVYYGLTFNDSLKGKLDEYLKIDPEAINGIWLSPIAPFKDSAIIVDSDPLHTLIIDTDDTAVKVTNNYGYLILKIFDYEDNTVVNQQFITKTKTFNPPLVFSESERYLVQDMDNVKLIDLPYGVSVASADVTLVTEATSCYVIVSLKDGLAGRLEGWVGISLLPSLPINSNAQSSYVYSGQREYDREARTIQSNANAWKSSAASGSTGALFGALGDIGAVAGMAAGAAPGLIGYGVEMLYQNDEEQRILDRLKANQTPSLIMGDNCLIGFYGGEISIVKLVMDSYSEDQMTALRGQMGISVDELMTSCDALIRTTSPTGYYNIQNLIVSGNVPVSAKRWIREKFKTGVRLI